MNAEGLSRRDQRLLELLTATGHLTDYQAQRCLEAFAEARATDAELDLSGFLRARDDLVPAQVVEELLGAEEDRKRSGTGAVRGSGQGLVDARSGLGLALRLPEEGDGDEAPPRVQLIAPALDPDEGTGPVAVDAPPLPLISPSSLGVLDEGSSVSAEALAAERASQRARRASRRASRRKSARRSARRAGVEVDEASSQSLAGFEHELEASVETESETRKLDPKALAAASARADRQGDQDQDITAVLRTAKFDPAILAEASRRRGPRRPPAAAIGAFLLGAISLVALGLALGSSGDELPQVAQSPTATPSVSAEPDSPAPETSEPIDSGPEVPAFPDADTEQDLVQRAEEGARLFEAREAYAEALALYQDLPAQLRGERRDEIEQAEARLRELIAFKQAAERTLEQVAELRANGDMQAASLSLEACLAAHSGLRGCETGRRLTHLQFELLEAAAQVEVEASPQPTVIEEPPARVEAFEALAQRGAARVEALRERIAAERRAQLALDEEDAERARARTERTPLDLRLARGYVLRAATVIHLDGLGFTVRSAQGEVGFPWNAVAGDEALRIRRLAVRSDVGLDQLRLGIWCLKRNRFEEAREAFQRALELDPSLLARIPDVGAVERARQIFAGDLEHAGNAIEVRYPFLRAAEASDWSDEPGARGALRDGRLEVRGSRLFLSALPPVPFEDAVVVEARLGPAMKGSSWVLGVAFASGTPGERAYLLAVDREGGLSLLERRGGRTRTLERHAGVGPEERVYALELSEQRIRVRASAQTLIRATGQPLWEQGAARVLLGGASSGDGGAAFEDLTVRGRVQDDWLRKSLGEGDAVLRGILARLDELPVFARPQEPPPPRVRLSAEDPLGLAQVPPAARDAYTEALRLARSAPLQHAGAASAFTKVLELAPGFAAARYQRALALQQLDRPRLALAELALAIDAIPRFYEAHAARARLLAELGELDEAAKDAAAALEHRPDHAPAHAALGRIAFLGGELKEALEAYELALALDPWDEETRSLRRGVDNVLAGPPWDRTFSHETAHYVVQTDISSRRCREYADELELIRGYLDERASHFGLEARPLARKDRVLIFDTREGFHTYAELTTNDRVESLLGYYHPRYRQLLLYEDKDDPQGRETRRVLYHEGFHQFIHRWIPEIPYWLNEGLAEYFSTCQIEGLEVSGEGGVLPDRLQDMRGFLALRGEPLPFANLMQETPAEFYSGPVAIKYAQAWSMVLFFLRGPQPELGDRLRRYFRLLLEGTGAPEAFADAWGGVDWQALQRSWRRWLASL